MLPLWYGGSMSYYVYDGSGLSAVCWSVLSFCLHACKLWCDLSFVYYKITPQLTSMEAEGLH